MNERTTLEKIAPNVEEAIAQGLAELGMTKDAVDVEVLDEGDQSAVGNCSITPWSLSRIGEC